MPRPTRFGLTWVALATCAAASAPLARAEIRTPDRVYGLDISAWQGNLSQTTFNTWKKPVEQGGGGRDFVFIRSSRGGTTGFYDQSDSANNNGLNTLSQRYDDPYFVQNITRATNAGMYAGAYHFARPDIIASTKNANGIPNNGTDEANHFLEQAGAYMRPGYLLPVLDLEAGMAQRSSAELTQFAMDFLNRIKAVKGFYPQIYSSINYARYVGTSVNVAPLWLARWHDGNNPTNVDTSGDPGQISGNVYGAWAPNYPTYPNPTPWKFWQYTSQGHLPGYGGNLDLDVAHGDIEFLKDFLVPALWTKDADGQWTTITNWNTDLDRDANGNPTGKGPAARLPGADDTIILDRPAGNVTVTLSSGVQTVRKLVVKENLVLAGGTLSVQYAPEVQANGTLRLAGGTLAAPGVSVQQGGFAEIAGGVTASAALALGGTTLASPDFTGVLSNEGGDNTWAGPISINGTTQNQGVGLTTIGSWSGTLTVSGVIGDGTGRGWAKVDRGDVVLTGPSANTYTGLTRLFYGRLIVEKDGALGSAGSATAADANFFQLANQPSTLAFRAPGGSAGFAYDTFEWLFLEGTGTGPSGTQLDNLGGDNVFRGNVAVGGPNNTGVIGVTAGSLEITGRIDGRGGANRTINKVGPGTLILSGDSAGDDGHANATPLGGAAFNVMAGTVALRGTPGAGGNIPGIAAWNVAGGGTLEVASQNNLGPSASINFTGAGTLRAGAEAVRLANAVNIAAAARVEASAGRTLTLVGAVTGQGAGGLTKVGPGTLVLAGSASFAPQGGVVVEDGIVRLANGGAVRTFNLGGVAVLGGGTFDLETNVVVASFSEAVRTLILSAYHGGDWDGAGVTSSAAAADASGATAVGYGDGTGAVTLRYTWYGDANLDGTVTAADAAMIDASGTTWSAGDFNYDGRVSPDDYALFAIGAAHGQANISTVVPEPGVCAAAALAGVVSLFNRRKRGPAC